MVTKTHSLHRQLMDLFLSTPSNSTKTKWNLMENSASKVAKVFSFILFVSLTISGLAMSNNAVAQEPDAKHINSYVPNAKLVGKGMFSYYFWDVYTGELYAPDGAYQNQPPFALKLTYQRDLEGKKIAQRSIDEMKKQGDVSADDSDKWLSLMEAIFPDVSEGDVITGIATKEGTSVFYVNGEKADEIDDKAFTQRFFDIWLSDKTSEPKFRKKLLGNG